MVNSKILIVDDNYNKIQGIVASLAGLNIETEIALSSKCALSKLKNTQFDLLIIDLQIPEVLGEEISLEGGAKLLRNITKNTRIKKPTYIIGFTSHSDSYNSFKKEFDSSGWSLHMFDGDFTAIQSVIINQLRYITRKEIHCDVAIITALEHTEFEAVLKESNEWEPIFTPNDCSLYYQTTITHKNGKTLTLVAVCCHGMGMANASAITMKVCLKFSPKYLFMVGIAAGIKDKVKLGDILIADICWDWGNGKQTLKDGKPFFLAAPKQESLNEHLRIKLRTLVTQRTYLDEIYNDWPSSLRPEHVLKAHIGPVATGAVVLEDPNIVQIIKECNRETIGIEMEAYGVMLASKISSIAPPITVIIKSVCDYADPSKDDSYQGYAAYTSTKYAFKIMINELEF